MCKSIKTLYNFEPPATDEEVYSAALKYIRKVGGYTQPSKANQEPFNQAVAEIAKATSQLLEKLTTHAAPVIARLKPVKPEPGPQRGRDKTTLELLPVDKQSTVKSHYGDRPHVG
ncbi:MAG: DUF2277 domain-containing protein [Anaerolineae bacterium]|nr:MAG: DUF2277 domain-containing protein [Anaerolineae bacterium]